MHIVAIIPSRYASERLPAKPLRLIAGKSLIQRVYDSVVHTELFDKVIIATDHLDIFRHAKKFNADVMMTSSGHLSGTDRVEECAKKIKTDLVINIQGDEPFITKKPLELLINAFIDTKVQVGSMMCEFEDKNEAFDPNIVKVVCDINSDALYFSRSVIPFYRNTSKDSATIPYYKHIGVYAYRPDILKKFVIMPQGKLEQIERLEQLRLLENGYKIRMVLTDYHGIGVDTAADIDRAEKLLLKKVY